ncbi:MAG: SCO6745 family protein [Acidimicrobiales bacterium]
MWRLLEPVHAVTYFAPESAEQYKAVGLKGFWMGYFAGRAAAMGAVGPGPVSALFFGFAPALVRRALPDAWDFASPSDVLAARLQGARLALRRVGAVTAAAPARSGPAEERMNEALGSLRQVTDALDLSGRPLAAGLADLEWPLDPEGGWWHAATLLREHRGDGHVALLTAAGLDGCQSHVSLVATGAVPRSTLQPNRGWTDDEWLAAEDALRERGWIDASGGLTDLGRTERQAIEAATDRLAAGPWEALGASRCTALAAVLGPMATAVVEAGAVPFPNPMGLPPADGPR